jgi:hypothetical protein
MVEHNPTAIGGPSDDYSLKKDKTTGARSWGPVNPNALLVPVRTVAMSFLGASGVL